MKNNILLYGNHVEPSLEYLVKDKGYNLIDQKQVYQLGLIGLYKDVLNKTEDKYHKELLSDLTAANLPRNVSQNPNFGFELIVDSMMPELNKGNNVILNPFHENDLMNYKANGVYLLNTQGDEYEPIYSTQPDYTVDTEAPVKKQVDSFLRLIDHLKNYKV